jgi:hypothetical protein
VFVEYLYAFSTVFYVARACDPTGAMQPDKNCLGLESFLPAIRVMAILSVLVSVNGTMYWINIRPTVTTNLIGFWLLATLLILGTCLLWYWVEMTYKAWKREFEQFLREKNDDEKCQREVTSEIHRMPRYVITQDRFFTIVAFFLILLSQAVIQIVFDSRVVGEFIDGLLGWESQ